MDPAKEAEFRKRLAFEQRIEQETISDQSGIPNPNDPEVAAIRAQIANANRDAVKDLSFGEAVTTGIAREANKLGAGIADIYDSIKQRLGGAETVQEATESRAERERVQTSDDIIYDALSEEHPGAMLTGAVLPYMATLPVSSAASAVRGGAAAISKVTGKTIPKMLQRQVAKDVSHIAPKTGLLHGTKEFGKAATKEGSIGALEGAAHYDDTALSGAAFGVGGAAGGKIAGNVFGGNMNKLSVEDQRIVDWAKKNKLYVPPGMATGDTALQQMDGALATHRLTADKVNDALRESKRKENQLVTSEIAKNYSDIEPADILSNSWMDNAFETVGDKMDDLVANTMGEVSDDLALKSTDIVESYRRVDADGEVKKILSDWERRFYNLADSGELIDGKQYQQWSKDLRRAADNSRKTNSELSHALRSMKGVLDDSIEEGLEGSKKADWNKVRKDFALLSEMDKLKDKTRIKGINESGHVDMEKLAKKFRASPAVNNLSEVARLRKHQQASSLGTSAMLGRALVPYKPSESVGAAMLLGSRLPKGVPFIPDLLTGAYMSGYPHATGALPFLGRHTTRALELGVPRSLLTAEFGEPERETD